MIKYLPYRCSAVARCPPSLLLLSVALEWHSHAFATHARMRKNRATFINGTADVAGESNRSTKSPNCDEIRSRFRQPHFQNWGTILSNRKLSSKKIRGTIQSWDSIQIASSIPAIRGVWPIGIPWYKIDSSLSRVEPKVWEKNRVPICIVRRKRVYL